MIEFLLGILFLISIVLAVILGCVGCFCCCVGIPFYSICCLRCAGLSKAQRKYSPTPSQVLIYRESTNNAYASTPLAENVNDPNNIPLAEAFIVPPLLASATVMEGQSGHHMHPHIEEAKLEEVKENTEKFQDLWAGILFVINFIVLCYFAFKSFHNLPSLATNNENPSSSSSPTTTGSSEPSPFKIDSLKDYVVVLIYSMILLTLASMTIALILKGIIRHAEKLIEVTIIVNIFVLTVTTICLLFTAQIIPAVFTGLFTIWSYWFYTSVRDRIPFASAILKTACNAVEQNFLGIVSTILFGCVMQVIWLVFWSLAFYMILTDMTNVDRNSSGGSNSNNTGNYNSYRHHQTRTQEDEEQSVNSLLMVWLVFSLYWGWQVINYVIGVSCSGAVATWWFLPFHPAPVRSSLFRALTSSFGSICFGSAIVAVLQTLRWILERMRAAGAGRDEDESGRSRGGGGEGDRERNVFFTCFLIIVETLLAWIEGMVLYFNRYAYAYIAAYGYGFVESGQKVIELFENKGLTTIVNDNLLINALNMLSLIIVAFCAFIGFCVAAMISPRWNMAGLLIGAILGLLIGFVLQTALDNAIVMVYICFAEDPMALQKTHPNEFATLRNYWEIFHPSIAMALILPNTLEEGMHPMRGQGYQNVSQYNSASYQEMEHEVGGPGGSSHSGRPGEFNPYYVEPSAPYQRPPSEKKNRFSQQTNPYGYS